LLRNAVLRPLEERQTHLAVQPGHEDAPRRALANHLSRNDRHTSNPFSHSPVENHIMGFRIPVQGRIEGASDKESTHVELNVNHLKDRKLAYLRVGPLEVKDGWETRRITFGMNNFLNLEPMARLNRKRLAALLEDVKHQVSEKSGPAWELFQAVCAENGLIPCNYKHESCEVV
jgi:hypothetical protein